MPFNNISGIDTFKKSSTLTFACLRRAGILKL